MPEGNEGCCSYLIAKREFSAIPESICPSKAVRGLLGKDGA